MTRRTARSYRVATALAGLVVVGAAAACTAPATATVHDEVAWDDGTGPTGSAEEDPRVEAVRRYDTLVKASTNELDLTDSRLAEVTTPEWIATKGDRLRSDVESRELELWEGPSDMTVVDVSGSGDEATVLMCSRLPTWWAWDDDASEVVERSRDTGAFEHDTYELVRVDDRWLVDSARWGYGPDPDSSCDPGAEVPVGRFTTAPDLDLLTTASVDDVAVPSS
ncbi:hypothetical protein ACH436_17520 [Isoptericola sp. NPDC019693]|uniref:hypothetical protein n=1 Tax=Isoptericola sp. NPDC019693 TaxID=3364009 RepID=UPI0037A4B28E